MGKLPYFNGKPRRKGKSTASDPMPRRQRGRSDPQGDRKNTVGVDYGTDLTRQGSPRTGDEIMQSSGRPFPDRELMRGGRK